MITFLLLLSGIAMVLTGVWLMVSIEEAKTLNDSLFSVLGGFIGLGFGLLLIIAAFIAL